MAKPLKKPLAKGQSKPQKAHLDKSQSRSGPAKDPVVQGLEARGLPVTRENYLKLAGLPEKPEPELEAELPPELQLGSESAQKPVL